MQTPICGVCTQTKTLCTGCSERLRNGEITECDITVSRLLFKYKQDFALDEVKFTNSLEFPSVILVFTATPAGYLIGRKGKIVNALSKELGKRIRVIQKTSDIHRLAEEILLPVKPLSINTLYKKNGVLYKIIISRKEAMRLPMDLQAIQTTFNKLLNIQTTIEFS